MPPPGQLEGADANHTWVIGSTFGNIIETAFVQRVNTPSHPERELAYKQTKGTPLSEYTLSE